jgi:tetratricopeptide (TPR) repeat protein
VRVVGAVIACALLVASGAAYAEAPLESAKRHFRAGVDYFDRGEYGRALDEFRAAKQAAPLPELDFNIARTYERMGDAAHAMRSYEAYLAARPGASDAGETRGAIERLKRRIGWLRIAGTRAGERVTVDDEPVEALRVAVTEGLHIVTVETRSASVRVRTGAEVDVELPPAPALLPAAPEPSVTRAAPERRSRRGLWIGLGVGGAVVVVAVAVTLGVVLSSPTDNAASARGRCQAPCMVFQFQ